MADHSVEKRASPPETLSIKDIAKALRLPRNWRDDLAWTYCVGFLRKNAGAIQKDLGPVPLMKVLDALGTSIRCQWSAAAKFLEDGLGRLGTDTLVRQLSRAVGDVDIDDDAPAAAPIVKAGGPPHDGGSGSPLQKPVAPWDVSSYA